MFFLLIFQMILEFSPSKHWRYQALICSLIFEIKVYTCFFPYSKIITCLQYVVTALKKIFRFRIILFLLITDLTLPFSIDNMYHLQLLCYGMLQKSSSIRIFLPKILSPSTISNISFGKVSYFCLEIL